MLAEEVLHLLHEKFHPYPEPVQEFYNTFLLALQEHADAEVFEEVFADLPDDHPEPGEVLTGCGWVLLIQCPLKKALVFIHVHSPSYGGFEAPIDQPLYYFSHLHVYSPPSCFFWRSWRVSSTTLLIGHHHSSPFSRVNGITLITSDPLLDVLSEALA